MARAQCNLSAVKIFPWLLLQFLLWDAFIPAASFPLGPRTRRSCNHHRNFRSLRLIDQPTISTCTGDLDYDYDYGDDDDDDDDDAKVPYLPLIQSVQKSKLDESEASRIFHGRGGLFQGLEHITVDWFPPVWLITSYNDELKPKDIQSIQRAIEDHQQNQLGISSELNIVYQFRSQVQATTTIVKGGIPSPHVITENGIKFHVRLDRDRNHGIFLDMARGRDWIRQRAQGKTILNLFAYTCGFSLAALAGGAESVINIDMVDGVLKTGQRNHDLNSLKGARFFAHDIFKSWGKIRQLGPYDVIVADPPTYQKSSFVAKKDYGKVIRRLPDMLKAGGSVMLCLNAPELDSKWLLDLVATEAPSLVFQEWLENPPSFASADPEKGLKVLLFSLTNEMPIDSPHEKP